ncbi:hypothetical protein E6O75_ATG00898 [Venturia nashicola]|uniref:Uncharacterized protein n=1 Tax=Venturia nashicola TaxID=86259 RepID=A0A4Z1PQK5_9PEZI|nr:hypothetical protein E6O75_ATG00898 [Venturia nashicola]
MREEILYSEVNSSESESDTKSNSSHRWPRIFVLCVAAILSSSAIILLLTTIFPLPKGAQVRQCGTSSSEAKAKGCQFDPVTFAWLPDAEKCHDHELADEWRKGDFKIYADTYGNFTKTEAEFGDDLSPAYITTSVHLQHCTFAWRMMHRAFMNGKTPHSGLSYAHTKHCSSIIVKHGDGNIIETGAKVTYPAC